ncbi:MAG: hypothetical protein ACRCYQ_06410 [Nocardioides sp.]
MPQIIAITINNRFAHVYGSAKEASESRTVLMKDGWPPLEYFDPQGRPLSAKSFAPTGPAQWKTLRKRLDLVIDSLLAEIKHDTPDLVYPNGFTREEAADSINSARKVPPDKLPLAVFDAHIKLVAIPQGAHASELDNGNFIHDWLHRRRKR